MEVPFKPDPSYTAVSLLGGLLDLLDPLLG